MEVSSWSLWQSRQFMFRYEGASLQDGIARLQETLELLEGSTNAIYTLKVYERFEGRITNKTQDDGSFNFRMNVDAQIPTVGALGAYNRSNELVSRLAAIEERLKEKENEEDEDEEGFSLGKVLSGVLQQPGALEGIANFVSGLLNNTMKTQTATALAGIEAVPPIKESLQVLGSKVEDLPAILAKLARLAEKNPGQFQFYMGALRSMNL
jgi:hypothetical protein